MLLIGHRTEKRNEDMQERHIFLLQNWWKAKQFVEVDDEYLANCNACLFFVKSTHTKFPQNLSTLGAAKYVEHSSGVPTSSLNSTVGKKKLGTLEKEKRVALEESCHIDSQDKTKENQTVEKTTKLQTF